MDDTKKYNSYTMEIESGGYAFYVCYGQHGHGWYIAIPNFETCVEAGNYDDINYNLERLSSVSDKAVADNAENIVKSIKECMEKVDFLCEDNTLLEYCNIRNYNYVDVPDYIKVIGDGAFSHKESRKITDVTLHDGITEIGESAFDGCRCLESINIPDSVKVIKGWAFDDCTRLKSIQIPYGCEVNSSAIRAECEIIQWEKINMEDVKNADGELDLTEQGRGRS